MEINRGQPRKPLLKVITPLKDLSIQPTLIERDSGKKKFNLDLDYLKEEVYDIIRTIQDPEKPLSLEDLGVVQDDLITVYQDSLDSPPTITIIWVPTTPDCHLATTIALCLRTKLFRELSCKDAKIDILVQEGKHTIKDQIDKQVNDKERVLAAMENEAIRAAIEDLIKERTFY
ncbi:hypothetical protein FGO68_gene7357 [Halteria grandinella]|uniref:MIP18 family-like domain-containing protein n=1 Tax=Halteria grandinella TaxID=5974 RepID=A0A8J8SYQ9_HALGN|nr:hypothetical protein FGO68_gene7357 [Halteria grandinella]